MVDRIREVLDDMLARGQPMVVRDGDEEYTLTQRDVDEIRSACGCSEDEARDRLAEWVAGRIEDDR